VRNLARVVLSAAIPIVMLCALLTLQLARRPQRDPVLNTGHAAAPTEAETPAAPDPNVPDDRDQTDDSPGSVDLYGNDVTDAVAQYKFDGTGALYELHSPQTEVPRLRSPKT
jgi:hypothetical protein